jgi:hypothetical protein
VLFISNGPGNDPHNPALGRILSEQDIKVARIADARIAEVFDRLDISTEEEFGVLCPTPQKGIFQKIGGWNSWRDDPGWQSENDCIPL